MKRYVLFSMPSPEVIESIIPLIFPKELEKKVVAYMPSDGADVISNEKYMPFWQDICSKMGVSDFNHVDNSKIGQEAEIEKQKIAKSNILIVTGGNTYSLLNNIRNAGLDKAIVKLSEKDDAIITGFSAGAAILTPTINIVSRAWSYGLDENKVGLKNLEGLGLVDFEVLPHFTSADLEGLEAYRKSSKYEVRPIANSEFILIEN